ncbi:uncharacterized protein PSFLO_06046 [Pseudozyma flocculosa]|uniref:Uncharacterized protein n=1 Tax=Pseudozyma flocculosa TaxID=84751 RepID=A0A5C3F7T0_9BASI|nr:uncharacterized protein PSFLO_06046 [Pseudozyma flocculosa]
MWPPLSPPSSSSWPLAAVTLLCFASTLILTHARAHAHALDSACSTPSIAGTAQPSLAYRLLSLPLFLGGAEAISTLAPSQVIRPSVSRTAAVPSSFVRWTDVSTGQGGGPPSNARIDIRSGIEASRLARSLVGRLSQVVRSGVVWCGPVWSVHRLAKRPAWQLEKSGENPREIHGRAGGEAARSLAWPASPAGWLYVCSQRSVSELGEELSERQAGRQNCETDADLLPCRRPGPPYLACWLAWSACLRWSGGRPALRSRLRDQHARPTARPSPVGVHRPAHHAPR